MPDGIVLVGMPGSGKSTIARLVAERLGRPLIDTDELVALRLGVPVPAYLAQHGEAAFREAEAIAVVEACAVAGAVIAAGGGAVLDPLNRWRLWHHGTVAWLDASTETLVTRLRDDPTQRPTFQPYDAGRLAEVLAQRAPAYRAADARLDAGRSADELADEVLALPGGWPGRRLLEVEVPRHHPIGPERTRVVMGAGLDLSILLPPGVAVIDRRAPAELLAGLPARARLLLDGGERAKRMRPLERLLEWLAEQRVERDEPLLAVGGGTIGDLAGTAAAVFARGIPLAHVPTTWVAQADSAIGGKVAVDLRGNKNAVGAFWPPLSVISDVEALRTLPPRLRRDGMAESVKSALIGDAALWRLLETHGAASLRTDEPARYAIVERSARLKLAICDRDPFEAGERRTLNLGHTIGHALEIESSYRLRHGEAVALGLRAAVTIAARRGAEADLPERLDDLLASLGFELRRAFDAGRVRDAMLGDKKRRGGRQRWILPMCVGRVEEADDVTDQEVARALRAVAA